MSQITQQQVEASDESGDLSTQLASMKQDTVDNAQAITANAAAITASQTAIAANATKINNIPVKGKVNIIADLPANGNTTGDVYFVTGIKQFYMWDGALGQWVPGPTGPTGPAGPEGPPGPPGTGGTGTGTLTQLTKLGVVGSTATPKDELITIPSTLDFKRSPVEILKFVPAPQDVVSTLMDFNNADSTSFAVESQIIFDGTMHLKTSYVAPTTNTGALGAGILFNSVIDKTAYQTIEKIGVN